MANIDSIALVKETWGEIKPKWKAYFGVGMVIVLAGWLPGYIDGRLGGLLGFIFHLVGLVVSAWVGFRVMKMSVKAARGEDMKLADLWEDITPDKNTFIQYIVAMIVMGVLVSIGMIFLIIPGIVISIMLSQTGFLIVDKGLRGMDALTESRVITKGNRWALFVMMLVLMAVNMVGMLALFIGMAITIPLTSIVAAKAYLKLSNG